MANNSTSPHGNVIQRLLPWLFSALIVAFVMLISLFFNREATNKSEEMTIRKIDVALPPPPPPEMPNIQSSSSDSATPTIDLLGQPSTASFAFSKKTQLPLDLIERIENPKFDVSKLDLSQTLALDFPVVEVKQLDSIPKAISTVSIRYPRSLVKKGIKRVDTQVELIIDQQGRAYIKKITDAVHPELIPSIRKWVENVRFSIPTKNGRPVQAIYPYTIRFIYRA